MKPKALKRRVTKSNLRIAVILVAVFLSTAAVTSWALYRDLLHKDCGLRFDQAKIMVIEDLRERGLPERPLRASPRTASCRYDFRYDHAGARIDYAVHGDWVDGAVLIFRDRTNSR